MDGPPILVVCGLGREAALAAGPGIVAIAGGGNRSALEARLRACDEQAFAAVVSFGLAGALDPLLTVGDIVLGTAVTTSAGADRAADEAMLDRWSEAFRQAGLPARTAAFVGVDRPILGPDEKAGLRADTGAAAVDMESHLAAGYAARRDIPFGILRAISDGAGRALPAVAGRAMRPDGSVDIVAVIRGLARDPAQLPALLATARDAGRAFRALRRVRGLLGPRLGLHL